MPEQLPLFSEPDKPEKSETCAEPSRSIRNPKSEISEEDPIRARWDQRLADPSAGSGHCFENWLRSRNLAKRTIQGYTTDIQQLLDFLEGEGQLETVIDTDDLIAFLADLQKEGARSPAPWTASGRPSSPSSATWCASSASPMTPRAGWGCPSPTTSCPSPSPKMRSRACWRPPRTTREIWPSCASSPIVASA